MKTARDHAHNCMGHRLTCRDGDHSSLCDSIAAVVEARDVVHAAQLATAREEAGEWAARASTARRTAWEACRAAAVNVAHFRADKYREPGCMVNASQAGERIADAIAVLEPPKESP